MSEPELLQLLNQMISIMCPIDAFVLDECSMNLALVWECVELLQLMISKNRKLLSAVSVHCYINLQCVSFGDISGNV